jgi:dTDP-4-dehydrorhamnose 3,5-epimerase
VRDQIVKVEQTELPGVVVLTPKRFGDERGFFSEVYNAAAYAGLGIDVTFVQDNHSLSRQVGVVRGLHFQAPPHAQDKLVRVGAGRVLDVAVDIRKGSPTYGRWVGVELSAEVGNQIFIPKGFLHGFATLAPDSELLYKCSDLYAPDCDGAVRFDDPDIGIDWGMDSRAAILSDKDASAPLLKDFDSPFIYGD